MKSVSPPFSPRVALFDVDGVLSSGQFLYTESGKVMKVFGPDDNDALSLLKPYVDIQFVTGDKKGWAITEKRVAKDMKYPLHLVSTIRRIDWIAQRWNPKEVIYMGDGIFDHYVFEQVGYAISTANGDPLTKSKADYVTQRNGAERAVAEAALHILEKFFEAYSPNQLPPADIQLSGEWSSGHSSDGRSD